MDEDNDYLEVIFGNENMHVDIYFLIYMIVIVHMKSQGRAQATSFSGAGKFCSNLTLMAASVVV